MKRSGFGMAAVLGGSAWAWACSAAAETAYTAGNASFLTVLTERLEFTLKQIPALGRHLVLLPGIVGGRTALVLLGIVIAGLVAEVVARLALSRALLKGFDRLVGRSPLRAFGLAILFDFTALIALAVAGRLVVGGKGAAVPGRRFRDVGAVALHAHGHQADQ